MRETLRSTSIEGPGLQTLDWSAEQREWFVVAMSSDGSAGADAYLVLGVGFFNVIQGVFALGLISLLGGGFLAFRGAGKPRTEPGDVAVTSVGENKTRDLR